MKLELVFTTILDMQLNIDPIWNYGNSLDIHQQWKLTEITNTYRGLTEVSQIEKIIDTYNRLIEKPEIMEMVQYILSSSNLTLNILNLPKEQIELNNQVVERLKRFKSLVEFISEYHKHRNDFQTNGRIFLILSQY